MNTPVAKTLGKTPFSSCNPDGQMLFRINPDICVEDALEHASCLMDCVNRLSQFGTTEENSESAIWAAHYLGEMAKAIIDDVTLGLFQARNNQ
ncbi:hypothetical protein D3C84_478890 [compost metagenome]